MNPKQFRLGLIGILLLACTLGFGADETRNPQAMPAPVPDNPFHGKLAPAPNAGAFRMDDYITWCGSVIQGEDGRYYMFASRWPKALTMRNWVTNSEIVLASSESPEGPFTFEQVVLPSRGPEFWDGMMTHNPSIHRHNGQYVLFYIGLTYDFEKPIEQVSRDVYEKAWNGKRIGVAVADSPRGPWKRMDQPILEPRPGEWDGAITSNPAPLIEKDGSVLLIYKSAPVPYPERNQNRALSFGVARAPHVLGPYQRINDGQKIAIDGIEDEKVEDPCIWKTGDTYHMVAKIFSERLTGQREAGFHATSKDGVRWSASTPPKAYDRTVRFQDGTTREQKKLERPQVLLQGGIPTHLYFATADPDWADIYNLVMPLQDIPGTPSALPKDPR